MKRVLRLVTVVSLVALLTLAGIGCGQAPTGTDPAGTTEPLVLGGTAEILATTVPATGGRIEITRPTILPPGLEIIIPAGSYETETDWTITYTSIKSHSLGPYFNPATPLITIRNNCAYAAKPVYLSLPIAKDEDEFAMGFFYDRATGSLEGIPQIYQDNEKIILATRHFSDIVVSQTAKAILTGGEDPESGFLPGTDDWQFTNLGSYAAPGGHCAGQSLSAVWYYNYQRRRGEPPLYGRLDNNGGEATPDFWYDDALGYRMASSVQRDYTDFEFLADAEAAPEELFSLPEDNERDWLALRCALLVTGRPQFLGISRDEAVRDAAGNVKTVTTGHAVVVYKIAGERAYVADPNYPGSADRYIVYADKKFRPYNSGENAAAIATGGEVAYDRFEYEGEFAVYNADRIAARWTEVENRDLGNDCFPYPMVVAADGTRLFGKDFTFHIDMIERELAGAFQFRLCRWEDRRNWLPVGGKTVNPIYDGAADSFPEYTVELKEGENRLGFYVTDKADRWANYLWIDVYVDSGIRLEAEQTVLRPGESTSVRAVAASGVDLPELIWTVTPDGGPAVQSREFRFIAPGQTGVYTVRATNEEYSLAAETTIRVEEKAAETEGLRRMEEPGRIYYVDPLTLKYHGPYEMYADLENTRLCDKGQYDMGVKVGKWSHYNAGDGSLASEAFWRDDKLYMTIGYSQGKKVVERHYDEAGNVTETITFD